MIWIIFVAMAIAAIAFLGWPLFTALSPQDDIEIASYFAQIDAIKANADINAKEAEAAILTLKRQILAKQGAGAERSSSGLNGVVLALVVLIGGGVYYTQSEPLRDAAISPIEMTNRGALAPTDQRPELTELVEQLEARLRDVSADDPTGWLLYARSLMTLKRFDDALAAYDRALMLTDNRDDIIAERASASRFAAQQKGGPAINAAPGRGPTEADVRDAQNMSEADRQAMIQGMVDGLAARLNETPGDPQGWARLIRARVVLGQTDQALADIAVMRDVFKDDPETVERILEASEWAEEGR